MSDPTPTPTPQPVVKTDAVAAAIVLLLTQLNPAAAHFGWWHLSSDDLSYIGQIVGAVFAFGILVKGWLVHNVVTPTSKSNALVAQALATPPPGKIVLDPPRAVEGEMLFDRPADGPVGMWPPGATG